MIWDYQRTSVFTVIWHGYIKIELGQLIKVTGHFAKPGHQTEIVAKAIIERDGTVHEQSEAPDEGSVKQDLYPVEGRVLDCAAYGSNTIIHVYQTIPNLFSFPNLSHQRAFLALPEFWNFLEEKSEYDDLVVPRGRQLAELRDSRFDLPDIRDKAWAIQRYGTMAGLFDQQFVAETWGKIHVKLEQLDRLRKRAAFGNRMKLHLFTLSISEGRSFLLDELIQEGPMTFEHAAFVVYSVLDLCAQLVNRTLELGLDDQKTSFTSVLGKASDTDASKSLGRTWPGHPVTEYWSEQQTLWIAKFRKLRHYFAHEGTAIPIHGPNERLLTAVFDYSYEGINENFDVESETAVLLDRVTSFFLQTVELLANHSIEAVKPYEAQPVEPSILAPTSATELESAFNDVLRLMFQTSAENPNRAKHLYSRLERTWRKRWPMPKFTAFIESWEGVGLKPLEPASASINGHVASMGASLLYKYKNCSRQWVLRLEKPVGGKPELVGNSLTFPCFPEDFVSVSDFNARQSGRETGHRCAEFRFKLTNTSSHELREVEAIILHGGLEAARASIGTLLAGDERDVYAITTPELGTLLPPGGPYMFVTLTSEPVIVRVVYSRETEFGSEWAEEHRCANRRS